MRLECLVHPFMAAVLLRMARFDAFRMDSQTNPPVTQAAQSCQTDRGKGTAVICPNDVRQSVPTEGLLKACLGPIMIHPFNMAAAQEVPAGVIGNRQRIAPTAILRLEVALEVRTPDLIDISAIR